MGRLKCAAPRLVSSLAVGGRRVAYPVSPTRDERRVPCSSHLRIFLFELAPSAVHTPWPSCAGGWPGAGRGEERNLSRRRRKSAPTTSRSCPCGAGGMPGAGRGEEGNLSRRQRTFRPHDKSASWARCAGGKPGTGRGEEGNLSRGTPGAACPAGDERLLSWSSVDRRRTNCGRTLSSPPRIRLSWNRLHNVANP